MLTEIIDQFYREQESDRKQTRFYVTDAGKCHRFIFFKFKQAPHPELEPRILRLFDHGNYIHRLIIKALSEQGVLEGEEVNIPPQEIISGRADALLKIDNQRYVLDIKSINRNGFQVLKEPKKDHQNQLQLYLHFFQIKKGILLYVNKDTQALKEFSLPYDSKLSKSLLDDLFILRKEIDQDLIPARLPNWPGNPQCRYCPYKDICSMIESEPVYWDQFKERIKAYEKDLRQNNRTKFLFPPYSKSR
jgi:CRISPR/Cas system-associated exonuclease Cas4 (RecB family)